MSIELESDGISVWQSMGALALLHVGPGGGSKAYIR
jgi:hypothetical protein